MYDLEDISKRLIEKIEDVLGALDIVNEYSIYNDRLTMCCPIHEGDNPEGFSILLRGVGNWQCFTHACHQEYGTSKGASIISLIQAHKKISFGQAVNWAAKFLGVDTKSVEDVQVSKDKSTFIQLCRQLAEEDKPNQYKTYRKRVLEELLIPSEYFLCRGYSTDILKKYDVGNCINKDDNRFNRAVVPLHDISGNYVLGYASRSVFDKCDKCNYFHDPLLFCPVTKEQRLDSVKWKFNSNFNAESYIYNLWSAIPHIEKHGSIILVESPGNVWRLEEAGIYNALALMGVKFTLSQKRILQSLGATDLIVALDNDEAGQKANKMIMKECGRMFNVSEKIPTKNDWGEIQDLEEIRKIFNVRW